MPQWEFVDAFKEARPPFGIPGGQWLGSCKVGADGWPIEDFSVIVLTAYPGAVPAEDISGTYHLSFNGQATISPLATSFTVQNQVYTASTNVTTADLVVPSTATDIIIAFTHTVGETSNIRLIRPPYPANTTQEFTTAFLQAVAPFTALRCMDYLSINNEVVAQTPTAANNWGWGFTTPPGFPGTAFTGQVALPVKNWANRHVPSDPFQQDLPNPAGSVMAYSVTGASYEYLIDLANQTGKDLWVNLPIDATDDYITQLATLFRNNLKPNLHIYLEYSNEVWNSSFAQFGYNLVATQNELNAGGSQLAYDGDTNIYELGTRRAAERLMQISNLFKAVYGAAAINTTVRPVFAWQIGSGYGHKIALDFINAIYGPPNHFFYAIAHAPYYGNNDFNGTPGSDTSSVTVPDLLTELSVDSNSNRALNIGLKTVATYYGLHCFAYEGGPGLISTADAANDLAVGIDPGITAVMEHDFTTNWYSAGGELYMYYDLANNCGTSWSYGLTSNINNLQTPKYEATTAVLAGALPAVTAGNALPATLGQSVTIGYASATNVTGPPVIAWQNPTAQYDNYYLLSVPINATYQLSLSVQCDVPASVVSQVQVDNQATQTFTWPNTTNTASTPPISETLTQGLHVLRLGVRNGGGNTYGFTFSLPSAAPTLNLTSVVSNKTHGGAVSYSLPLPLTGNPGIECRSGGSNLSLQLVFTFSNNISSVAGASVASGMAMVNGAPVVAGNQVTLNLTGVTDDQWLTVGLNNVTDVNGTVMARAQVEVGLLLGDVNGNKVVTSADMLAILANAGQALSATNFQYDINANGAITSADALVVKPLLGHSLP